MSDFADRIIAAREAAKRNGHVAPSYEDQLMNKVMSKIEENKIKKIIEFENMDIEKLQEKVAKAHRFTIYSHKLELYGLCFDCAKSNSSLQKGKDELRAMRHSRT